MELIVDSVNLLVASVPQHKDHLIKKKPLSSSVEPSSPLRKSIISSSNSPSSSRISQLDKNADSISKRRESVSTSSTPTSILRSNPERFNDNTETISAATTAVGSSVVKETLIKTKKSIKSQRFSLNEEELDEQKKLNKAKRQSLTNETFSETINKLKLSPQPRLEEEVDKEDELAMKYRRKKLS